MRITQRVTDLYLARVLTLKEMCDILRDVDAANIAERFETMTNPAFMAGPDGFLMKNED